MVMVYLWSQLEGQSQTAGVKQQRHKLYQRLKVGKNFSMIIHGI
jgi:hypothetical protein